MSYLIGNKFSYLKFLKSEKIKIVFKVKLQIYID